MADTATPKCDCVGDWELCIACMRLYGFTHVHITPDGTCAWSGHRQADHLYLLEAQQ